MVLGRTPGVTPEHVAECLRVGRLEPPPTKLVSEEMPSAIGLFRGQSVDYVLAIAQVLDSVHIPQLLYIPMEASPVRWLAGNIRPFLGLAHAKMKAFQEPRHDLAPFKLDDPHPADMQGQSEAINDLLIYCEDNMKVIEALLTALIQNKNIAIINAPNSLEKRLRVVEGLISLLPNPARVVLTFATNVIRAENSTAQIKFMGTDTPPQYHVIFDWANNTITPAQYERHDYARFIVSQIRLDPDQAVTHMDKLARTASWRAIRKDNLSTALHWVSRRAKVDSAVQAGQPADRETVAAILRSDPTLTDELRVVYSKHLLSFAVAIEEWRQTADVLASIAVGNRPVAEAIFAQMRELSAQGHALDVFNLVEHWLLNVHEARSLPWQQALFAATTAHIGALFAEEDYAAGARFMCRLCNADPIMQFENIAPQVIREARQFAHLSPELAQAVVLVAADFAPAGGFQDLLTDAALVSQLPRAQQQAIALLQPEINDTKKLAPNTLAAAAATLPSVYQAVFLVRLVELALYQGRSELIGEHELQQLLRLVETRHIERFQYVIKYIVEEFSKPERIAPLGSTGWAMLPQLYFMVGFVEEGIELLEYYQNHLFTVERLSAFGDLLNEVFLRIELSSDKMLAALAGFEGSKIRVEARTRAYFAALTNQQWDVSMETVARQLTNMFYTDHRLLRLVGVTNSLRLLQFHARQTNMLDSLRMATALMQMALEMGEDGPPLLVKSWKYLTWQTEVRNAAIELLRRYVRQMSPAKSAALPNYFARQLGARVGESLKATRVMRIITGQQNFLDLHENIRLTYALLSDMATTYHELKEAPPLPRLHRDLDAMSGGVTEDERAELAANLYEIARLIYELGSQPPVAKATRRSTTNTSVKSVLREARNTSPQTSAEFLTWFGLYFTDDLVVDLGLEHAAPAHILGERSAAMFYRETLAIRGYLERLGAAFPVENPPQVAVEALRAEVESLWGEVRLYDQRHLKDQMGEMPQKIALLLRLIANRGSEKVLADKGLGKQLETGRRQPQRELEAFRWISGYFGRKHVRR